MSRSNPSDIIPNPSTRWFEWNAEEGHPKYYDKEEEKTEQVPIPFQFMLLDRLSVIKGWHNDSESGITSNEVRDTRVEPMTVRAFGMKEPIAKGLYADIKDKIKAAGGNYAVNIYIAFPGDEGEPTLGAFILRGAARGAWIEFESNKANRPLLYKMSIVIRECKHGEKGTGRKKIEWEAPVFELTAVEPDLDTKAMKIDQEILQPYLANYFKRTQPSATSEEAPEDLDHPGDDDYDYDQSAVQRDEPY
jgi:hypothetical protein